MDQNLVEWKRWLLSKKADSEDERWMISALLEAEKAYRSGEVPVGAVVVHDGRIIGRGHNQVELLQDATAHAEMLAIGAAAQYLSSWRLERCVLYSTLEPCSMCAGASILSRIDTVVWAAPDLRHGANGSLVDLLGLAHPIHRCAVRSAVLSDFSSQLMKLFFREQRDLKKG